MCSSSLQLNSRSSPGSGVGSRCGLHIGANQGLHWLRNIVRTCPVLSGCAFPDGGVADAMLAYDLANRKGAGLITDPDGRPVGGGKASHHGDLPLEESPAGGMLTGRKIERWFPVGAPTNPGVTHATGETDIPGTRAR